ncbi:hypothetical protein MJA45_09080 [Paenibacillus aurantius]|uniref:DUF6916 domain-containing protein n=1 Tax=Paenibacillus aurantius TaxID=2918900 RepID=A0AA96LHM9_9BACL|nr:hypothetical protein [Paenibacillus aurantius]WNQ13158.1 hypothetical protein MJA45_09080 [Paenibacillus aurantius]
MNGLSAATFRQLVQDKVEVVFDDGIVPLELVSVKESEAGKDFEHFSLVFRGDGNPFLPQGTYWIRHERFGQEPMFMVPIGQEHGGYRYEIVFNRKKTADGGVSDE